MFQAYTLSIELSMSDTFFSPWPDIGRSKSFTNPCRLFIYGGNDFCEDFQLLAISPEIDHSTWKNYEFLLIPFSDYSYITFSVYYIESAINAYNGHLLLDNLSNIQIINKREVIEKLDQFSNVLSDEFEYPKAYFITSGQ